MSNQNRIVEDPLSNTQDDLDQLDLVISRAQIHLTTLRRQSIFRMKRFRVALSNEKLLPAEVLSRIFVLSVPIDGVFLKHGKDATPWTYLCVCSRCRRVALDEHYLWNNLVSNASVRTTKAWLASLWSQNTTFLVSLDLGEPYHSTEIIDIVSRYSSRLWELSVNSSANAIFEFTTKPPLAFEYLQSVTLRWGYLLPEANSSAIR